MNILWWPPRFGARAGKVLRILETLARRRMPGRGRIPRSLRSSDAALFGPDRRAHVRSSEGPVADRVRHSLMKPITVPAISFPVGGSTRHDRYLRSHAARR